MRASTSGEPTCPCNILCLWSDIPCDQNCLYPFTAIGCAACDHSRVVQRVSGVNFDPNIVAWVGLGHRLPPHMRILHMLWIISALSMDCIPDSISTLCAHIRW